MSTTFLRLSLCAAALTLAALLGLSGCGAPTSVADLRANPHKVYSLEVPADCATIYQRIARRAQERYRFTNLATYQPGISAKLAPDAQFATVTLFNAGGLRLEYILTADLHAVDSAHTEVTIFCGSPSSRKDAVLWAKWANIPLETNSEPSTAPAVAPTDPNGPPPPHAR